MARTRTTRTRPMRRNYKRRGNTYPRRRRTFKLTTRRLNSRIRRVARKLAETKFVKWQVTGAQIYNTITDSNVQTLVPSIARGTGEADRVANEVTTQKMILRLNVYPDLANSGGDEDMMFDMYIFRPKRSVFMTSGDMAKFKDNGNSSTSFDGSVINAMLPVNNDRFTCHYFTRFKMNGTSQTFNPLFNTVPRSRQFQINLTKYVPKKVLFDDGTNSPENMGLYVAIGMSNPGFSAAQPLQQCAFMDYVVHYYYKDS